MAQRTGSSGPGAARVRQPPPDLPGTLPGWLNGTRQLVLRRILSRLFSEIYADLGGLKQAADTPVIAISNHASVYDGLVTMAACDSLKRPQWLGVHHDVLERRPWSRRLGYFALQPANPERTHRQLASIAGLMSRQTDGVTWLFPQGCIVAHGRQVPVRDGALRLGHQVEGVALVACSLHYELFDRRRPYAWLRCSAPVDMVDDVEALGTLLDDASSGLHSDLRHGTGHYEPLLGRSTSTVLASNLPVDLQRVAHALNVDLDTARHLIADGADEQTAAAVGRHCGALYRQLVQRAATE